MKLQRFKTQEVDFDDFVSRQLNDTRYATTQATEYVGLLYGGVIDATHRRRVQATKGGVTAFLRDELYLNGILNDGGDRKSRDDHRHHAVDAICVALTDAPMVKELSDAATRAQSERRRRFGRIAEPFEGFLEAARAAVLSTNVSHRFSRKINGPMHEETYYGMRLETDGSGNKFCSTRKPLGALSEGEVADIVDPVVRRAVEARLAELGVPAKKAFSEPDNHPYLASKDGRMIPIHRVKVRKAVSPQRIGHGLRQRNVVPGSNHHVEILETSDDKGGTRWIGRIVSRLEAVRRLRSKRPVVDRSGPDGGRFVMSLSPGEMIQIDTGKGPELYAIRVTSATKAGYVSVEYIKHCDARRKAEIQGRTGNEGGSSGGRRAKRKAGESDWKASPPDSLRKFNCRKVVVTPMGEVRIAND